MFSLELQCSSAQKDMLIAELWEAGSAGIVELEGGLRAFFEEDAGREALVARFQVVGWREEEQRDWVAESRANWEPLLVGERFFLVPQWRSDAAPEGRFRIVVNPGMAFGTGRHETTQLCLEAMERHVRAGASTLDVGTGTGILAQAAGLLGATPVWACDIDPEAVSVARAKLPLNLFVGSIDAVRSGAAGVVVANISPEAIALLAPDLLRCLQPDGIALLSGFERHEAGRLADRIERLGGTVLESVQKGDWALLVVGGKLVGGVFECPQADASF